jgi:hypothetical protein
MAEAEGLADELLEAGAVALDSGLLVPAVVDPVLVPLKGNFR